MKIFFALGEDGLKPTNWRNGNAVMILARVWQKVGTPLANKEMVGCGGTLIGASSPHAEV